MVLRLLIINLISVTSFTFAGQKTSFFLMPCPRTYNNTTVIGHHNSKEQPLEWTICLQFKDGLWTGIKEQAFLNEATQKRLKNLGIVHPQVHALNYTTRLNYTMRFEWLVDWMPTKDAHISQADADKIILKRFKELVPSERIVFVTLQWLHDSGVRSIKNDNYKVDGPLEPNLLTYLKNKKNWNTVAANLNDQEEHMPWIIKGSIMPLAGIDCPVCITHSLATINNDLKILKGKIR